MRRIMQELFTGIALSQVVVFASLANAGHREATSTSDIVETAVAAGQFSTLAGALQAAGLVETLKSEGPATVFAATDAAFAGLPEGPVESSLPPENRDQRVAIMTCHVVPGAARI